MTEKHSTNGVSQTETVTQPASKDEPKDNPKDLKREASWPAVLFYIHLNILGIYGVVVLFTQTSLITALFTITLTFLGIIGVTCGSHRLWAHRTYTASPSLRIFLMLCQTMAGQGSIYEWVRQHRLHHKVFKTPDDPYYSDKDLLHSQVLTQIRTLSVKQQRMLDAIDMSDIEDDKIVMFQKKFYWILYLIFFVLLPINAPLEYWNDTVQAALFVAFSLRYMIVINVAWLVNSAHFIWGLDKNFKQSDSNLIFVITKTYWPQYHYLMPWDYQTGEFGNYGEGLTTILIRVFAALELASDLSTISTDAVKTGLTMAVDSGRPVVDCLREAGIAEMEKYPKVCRAYNK
ncbi:acyl-CoA Delta-9 desaturase [Phlebotomus argentipes]|uniref:acyl-CoA Delta-9 desaturase n=1 Tax=Phlebotomus argentipes TaxID=94469 RepID=UPI002892B5EA|nr:acyl-CoA Delta-9 desaturase [Phlebotomus argentipes]XP_059612481.1 acyl-CoA Delta-9 desaturase [Phlebotomus argentipes]